MVHRIIVCQQSGFSEGACNGEFKVCNTLASFAKPDLTTMTQEASTGVITLEEERPFVVEMLLSFVYTGHYILPPAAHTILANEALLHLQAYTAGQRYLVAGLMEMAKQQFLDLVGSKIIRIDVLQEVINWFYHCIPDSNDLRIFRKQVALILRPELDCRMQDKKFRKLVRKEPEFAVELLMASFGEPQDRSATL